MPIIKQNIIFKIYEMTKIVADHEDCTQCKDVSELKVAVFFSVVSHLILVTTGGSRVAETT